MHCYGRQCPVGKVAWDWKGTLGQAGDWAPDLLPQVGRCCPQMSSLYTHGHPLLYIMGKVGVRSLVVTSPRMSP